MEKEIEELMKREREILEVVRTKRGGREIFKKEEKIKRREIECN